MTTVPDPARTPRNPWARARHVLALLAAGDAEAAACHLEMIRHHPALPAAAFAIYEDKVRAALAAQDRPRPINMPCAYTSAHDPRLRKPFRLLQAGVQPAVPYPAGMVLPSRAGAQNDTAFLRRAAAGQAGEDADRGPRVEVFLAADAATDVAAVAAVLMAQTGGARISLTVAAADLAGDFSLPAALSPRVVRAALPGAQAHEVMQDVLARRESDLTVFLSGQTVLDEAFISRAWYLAQVSDRVVQPLVARSDGRPLTGWHLDHAIAAAPYPFRALQGLDLVAPTALIRAVGLPDARFSSATLAAREIGWRMAQKGAWFAPLAVPSVTPGPAAQAAAEHALYVALCPNPLDRQSDGLFERPRVDVYIPAYNAAHYIRRAIDSVLEQDLRDLQVCVADDDSTDGTYALVQKHYGNDPRVRIETGPNGGIGHASNRAIAMGCAPYIGQLDSDDCLKPGALRRLVGWLDAHPETACVYGSCERIDAQGSYIRNEFNWPVFTREKMMVTSIAHHFRMFRRAAFARTPQFREDIANAVDYDLLLKLTETGEFHHVEEILYQRRWHGENTSDVNEDAQTANTHIAQNEALHRLGLAPFWELHIADPARPREVSYRRRAGVKAVVCWPAPAGDDPTYHLLYASLAGRVDICAGDVDAALEQLASFERPSDLTFHLHGLSCVLDGAPDAAEAFLCKVARFVEGGGRFVWSTPPDTGAGAGFGALEGPLAKRLAQLAQVVHFYSAAAQETGAAMLEVSPTKVHIASHGHYIGCYPDFVTRAQARQQLGLAQAADVILLMHPPEAQNAPEVCRALGQHLTGHPHSVILLAGDGQRGFVKRLASDLAPPVAERLRAVHGPVDEMALQVFMHAADVILCPDIPAGVLVPLGFGLPVVAPESRIMAAILGGAQVGALYDVARGPEALAQALENVLAAKQAGAMADMRARAQALARAHPWPDITPLVEGP